MCGNVRKNISPKTVSSNSPSITQCYIVIKKQIHDYTAIGVDSGGQPGHAPPIIKMGGQNPFLAPPIIRADFLFCSIFVKKNMKERRNREKERKIQRKSKEEKGENF